MNSNFVQSTMFGSKDINIATIYGFLIVNRTAYIYIYIFKLFIFIGVEPIKKQYCDSFR